MNKTLLAILRTSLWGEPLNCNITVTQTLLKALHQQCLEPLVAQTLLKLQLSEKQKSYLLQLVAATMKQHLKVNAVLAEEIKTYKNKGFNPILLKGQGCAYYYPNPVLRPTGDLDIYLGPKLNLNSSSSTSKHIRTTNHGVEVELHKYIEVFLLPWQNSYFQLLTEKYMKTPRDIQIGNTQISIPPIQFNALIVFNHLWHHFRVGGVGLRQFIDLAYILHKDSEHIDYEILRNDLKGIGLFKAWQITGCICVNYLGLSCNYYPFYNSKYTDKAELLLNLLIDEGNMGNQYDWGNTDLSKIKKKSTAFKIKLKRCSRIFQISRREGLYSILYLIDDVKRLIKMAENKPDQ